MQFSAHQGAPQPAERHDQYQCRHQVYQRQGLDLGHTEACRHGQDAAAGGQVCKHGGGQHTSQQLACAKDAQQDDALGQRDGTDGFPQAGGKDHGRKAIQHRLGHEQAGVARNPLRQGAVPAKAAAAEQGHGGDVEIHINVIAAQVQSLDQLEEEFGRPVFQMQQVADGKAHQCFVIKNRRRKSETTKMEVKVICTSAGNHDDLYDDAADGVCR